MKSFFVLAAFVTATAVGCSSSVTGPDADATDSSTFEQSTAPQGTDGDYIDETENSPG